MTTTPKKLSPESETVPTRTREMQPRPGPGPSISKILLAQLAEEGLAFRREVERRARGTWRRWAVFP